MKVLTHFRQLHNLPAGAELAAPGHHVSGPHLPLQVLLQGRPSLQEWYKWDLSLQVALAGYLHILSSLKKKLHADMITISTNSTSPRMSSWQSFLDSWDFL